MRELLQNTGKVQDPAHAPLRIDHRVAASTPDGDVMAGHQGADSRTIEERHRGQVDDDVDRAWCLQCVLDGGSQRTGGEQIDLADRGQRDDPVADRVSGR
nr:hypothetical protein [Nonomuraea guangzhouensis]